MFNICVIFSMCILYLIRYSMICISIEFLCYVFLCHLSQVSAYFGVGVSFVHWTQSGAESASLSSSFWSPQRSSGIISLSIGVWSTIIQRDPQSVFFATDILCTCQNSEDTLNKKWLLNNTHNHVLWFLLSCNHLWINVLRMQFHVTKPKQQVKQTNIVIELCVWKQF